MQGIKSPSPARKRALFHLSTGRHWSLILLICLGLLLRLIRLGGVFPTSDHAELAARILTHPGYLWILKEQYGAMIYVVVKWSAGLLSVAGVRLTEFWWRLPVALLGSIQAAATWFFLKAVGCREGGVLAGTAFVTILPIHVIVSRYLFGSEVFGQFFVTLAIWAVFNFFSNPDRKSGLVASLALAAYEVSHGYVLPFIPCFFAVVLFLAPGEKVLDRLSGGCRLLIRHRVWFFPVLFSPFVLKPVLYALRKKAALGVYNYFHELYTNVGWPLAVWLAASLLLGVFLRNTRSKITLFFASCGCFYVMPIFFGAPRETTAERFYLMIGTYFWILVFAMVSGELARARPKVVAILLGITFVLTLWGTVETVFANDSLVDPSLVEFAWGGIAPDPGTKAAGYVVRKYVLPEKKVLAIHRAIEPPNLYYYFARKQYAYYDLEPEETLQKFQQLGPSVDVVICDAVQRTVVERDGAFQRRAELLVHGVPTMWIYAREGINIPLNRVECSELNSAFDEEYSWRVSLR